MHAMRTLRHFSLLARLVLGWFVLSLGVAVASPIVKPQDILMVCTGTGAMKVLVQSGDDGSSTEVTSFGMDCPLCATVAAPPVQARVQTEPMLPLAYALQSIPAAHIAARTAAPLPARGPPPL